MTRKPTPLVKMPPGGTAQPASQPKHQKRGHGYQGFVDVRRQQRLQEEHADHITHMPKGFVRGLGDFEEEELSEIRDKLKRWIQTGAARPTMGAKSDMEEA